MIKEIAMSTVEELEQRTAEFRQEVNAERAKVRELKQETKSLKDKSRVLQQEVSRLQSELRKKNEELRFHEADEKNHKEVRDALAGVIAHRYGGLNPFDCSCNPKNWCQTCSTKVWARANKATGV